MSKEDTIRDRILVLFSGPGYREYMFNDLLDQIKPRDQELLASVLAKLTRQHLIEKVIRVESTDTHTGIVEFPSVLEVPSEVHDVYNDIWRTVTPDMLWVIYKKRAA